MPSRRTAFVQLLSYLQQSSLANKRTSPQLSPSLLLLLLPVLRDRRLARRGAIIYTSHPNPFFSSTLSHPPSSATLYHHQAQHVTFQGAARRH